MSQQQYLKRIETELRALNKIIDEKIMRGQEYRAESRQHKALRAKLREAHHHNFFDKLFSPSF